MLCDRILADSGVNFTLVDMPKGVKVLDKYEHFACCTGQTLVVKKNENKKNRVCVWQEMLGFETWKKT